jgi:hypothetical protein
VATIEANTRAAAGSCITGRTTQHGANTDTGEARFHANHTTLLFNHALGTAMPSFSMAGRSHGFTDLFYRDCGDIAQRRNDF